MRPFAPGDEPLPTPGAWFADGGIPRATIRLAPGARWVVERYPVDDVGEPDDEGWVTVRLPVASEHWLVRTLVRLGPDAEMLDPVEWRTLAAEAARRGARALPKLVERFEVVAGVDTVLGQQMRGGPPPSHERRGGRRGGGRS